ncbi:MAG: response regulator [Candidatus Methylarchaceae archaeon HK02M2]|nr:response regulator [Candidatus Methylarchaceae archaeon HK02M2]
MQSNIKILIVDDETITLKNLLHVMEKEGYEVLGVSSGPDALKILENQEFDVVLADLKMKKVDGIQILKRCKELYPDTQVIMITGYATVEAVVSAMKMEHSIALQSPLSWIR